MGFLFWTRLNASQLRSVYLGILLVAAGTAFGAPQPWPTPVNYVSDFANVIQPKYEQQMNQLGASLKERTKAEMAIVTIPSFSQRGFGSIEEAAVNLFKQWGIGRKGENDGLLILVAVQDRKWRIEVGYGLEGTIPDITASRLGRTLLPDAFRQGRYGDGLLNLTVGLVAEIAREKNIPLDQFNLNSASVPTQSTQGQRAGGSGIGSLFHLIIGIIVFLVLISNPRLFLLYLLFGSGRSRHWDGGSHFGGGFGGGGGGSFGGFGGGISGGGGSSGGW